MIRGVVFGVCVFFLWYFINKKKHNLPYYWRKLKDPGRLATTWDGDAWRAALQAGLADRALRNLDGDDDGVGLTGGCRFGTCSATWRGGNVRWTGSSGDVPGHRNRRRSRLCRHRSGSDPAVWSCRSWRRSATGTMSYRSLFSFSISKTAFYFAFVCLLFSWLTAYLPVSRK